jgi:alkylhydroperoxidase/carboxymuconolactone decarboxylase family protein YurZ
MATKKRAVPVKKTPSRSRRPPAPEAHERFLRRFPELAEAWRTLRRAEKAGPLDPAARRLIKLAVAVGAGRSGGVSSNVRKGLGEGVPLEAMEQVVACAASTIGMPAAVAAFGWIRQAAGEVQTEK